MSLKDLKKGMVVRFNCYGAEYTAQIHRVSIRSLNKRVLAGSSGFSVDWFYVKGRENERLEGGLFVSPRNIKRV